MFVMMQTLSCDNMQYLLLSNFYLLY